MQKKVEHFLAEKEQTFAWQKKVEHFLAEKEQRVFCKSATAGAAEPVSQEACDDFLDHYRNADEITLFRPHN